MRRVLSRVLVVVLACSAIAGCGSSGPGAPSAVSSALSYFPSSSPLVLSIETDPSGQPVRNLGAMIGNFPVAAFGIAYAKSRLQQLGINYDADIHPLFGNPIILGFADAGGSARTLLVAWVTRNANALATLVRKFHLHRSTTHDGATLYPLSGATIAVDGATVLFGTSQQAVMSALDRHSHGGGITAADMSSAMAGLPPHPFIEAFGNLTRVLSSTKAAKARAVPWVGALRGYALALNASSTGLTMNFKLDTSGAPLTASELPIASGTAPPSLAGTTPISVGVKDPAQIVGFVLEALRISAPGRYRALLTKEATLRRKTGADLRSLLSLLTGDLVIGSDTHRTIARVGVTNPSAAAAILAKLASQPGNVLPHATLTAGPNGFYSIKEKRRTINVGIAGGELVAGEATPAQLQAFAAAPSIPAPAGSQGSVGFRIALPALLQLAVKNAPPQLRTLLSSLGNITGWIAATPRALTGEATLALK